MQKPLIERLMKYFIIALMTLLGFIATPTPAFANSDPIYTSWRDNDAVGGYDTVSFFSGKPIEGKSEFQTSYNGAVWSFSTRANLDLFLTNPTAFAPQYGGYCAWAIAQGKLAKGSPQHWHVQDGRLFLNFNSRVQSEWNRDREDFITQADEKWPDILLK